METVFTPETYSRYVFVRCMWENVSEGFIWMVLNRIMQYKETAAAFYRHF